VTSTLRSVAHRFSWIASATVFVSAAVVLSLVSKVALADEARPDRPARPSLFLSCPLECFDAYLRQELSYFDFSRDPYRADFTLVVVRQPGGSGGERFTVALSRRTPEPRATPEPPRSFSVPFGTPPHTARGQLLQSVLRMLRDELHDTGHDAAFELSLPRRDGSTLSALSDPWDYWVIMPELRAEGEGGSGYHFVEASSVLTVRRVTAESKFRLRGVYGRRWSSYRLEDGSRIYGDIYGWESRAMYAHSLGRRWALGAVVTGRANEFENLDGHLHGGPLVEFNVFPYSENASRQLRIAYQAGVWANWYLEENTAGLFREVRPYHALSLIADVNQPWGSVQLIGQANSFLNDPELYRLSTGVVLSLRLFEGFAVSLEGEGAFVRDLINLRKRPVTNNELLLWTVQQPTDYTFKFKFALTYAFGSVHNTIVNPRFARVDLDEE
jgi:hypothetical protein